MRVMATGSPERQRSAALETPSAERNANASRMSRVPADGTSYKYPAVV